MAQGYAFELSDGSVVAIVPKDGATVCSASIGDTIITLIPDGGTFSIERVGGATASVAGVTKFERKNFDMAVSSAADPNVSGPIHTLRTCQICNGRQVCVTNSCADFGCGWMCD